MILELVKEVRPLGDVFPPGIANKLAPTGLRLFQLEMCRLVGHPIKINDLSAF